MADSARVVEFLELALIELEYAMADFAYERAKRGDRVGLQDLETIRLKLQAANRAIDLAIHIFGAAGAPTTDD